MKVRKKYIIGIDEVGRGPLAGPVTVGACICEFRNLPKLRKIFAQAKESKQLTAASRESWKKTIDQARDEKLLSYSIVSVPPSVIDSRGLAFAIRKALASSLKNLSVAPEHCHVKLDGGLKAPAEFADQVTIIKGDEKELMIALASIAAKVTRDAYMRRISKKHPSYGLDIHMGYGTAFHREAIRRLGPSPIHRQSFLRNILKTSKSSLSIPSKYVAK